MKRSLIAAITLAISTLTAGAFAEGQDAGKHGGKHFPMAAAEFRQKHDAHVAKARAKMEERIKERKLDAEKAKELRARFDAVNAKVTQAVAKVTADGTVTKDEAKEVRQTARDARREAHGGHGKGKRGAKRGKA
jgi:hypothetical protein